MTFGQKLRKLRETHNLTQKQMGDFLNTTQRKISYLETDQNEPCLEDIRILCRRFGISADYLLGISKDDWAAGSWQMAKKGDKKSGKGVDKEGGVCYNNGCEPRKTGSEVSRWERRCGGTGRRPGLKIPWYESIVPVRSRSPAPPGANKKANGKWHPKADKYRGVEQPGSSSGS